jgi:mRNA-degrading endonuclease toxin of MazEF toxin-antitoxin module
MFSIMVNKKPQPPKKVPIVKRFKAWNKLKFKLHFNKNIPAGYKERDIWWVAIGHNVGTEEDGKGLMFNRPVLVVKGFSRYQFWGIPLSTTTKNGIYYHQFVFNGKVSTALLSQLRVYDTRRLISKYGMAGINDFSAIKEKIISFLS